MLVTGEQAAGELTTAAEGTVAPAARELATGAVTGGTGATDEGGGLLTTRTTERTGTGVPAECVCSTGLAVGACETDALLPQEVAAEMTRKRTADCRPLFSTSSNLPVVVIRCPVKGQAPG